MPRNVEIKARVSSVEAVRQKAAAVADKGPFEITQDDTFFRCESGRLKLRAFSSDEGELIFYRRADQQGPKESFYLLSPTSAPDTLRESLSLAYGQTGRVRKQRTLFLAGRTRIHLDQVERLGSFLELEVILEHGEATENGIREAHILMERLGVQSTQVIQGAYVDLLAQRASQPSTQSEHGLGQERPGEIAYGEKRKSDGVSCGGCQCGSIRYEFSGSAQFPSEPE
jgi:predicted adenylyl cyclase CyaB